MLDGVAALEDAGADRPARLALGPTAARRVAARAADLDWLGVVGLAVHLVEDVGDLLAQRLRVDAVLLVVGDLLGPPALGLVDGLASSSR